jgi:enamine deaminase RidA (YjgF/YER057c/UK114 family)
MENIRVEKNIQISSFETDAGVKETFVAIQSKKKLSFCDALKKLFTDYDDFLQDSGLSQDTQVFIRLFLSDIENQKACIREVLGQNDYHSCSIIQQAPLCSGDISLLSYHLSSCDINKEILEQMDSKFQSSIKMKGKNYNLFFSANCSNNKNFDSFSQTEKIFNSYANFLKNKNMTMLNNTLRTWFYVRDIDNHYKGMVNARKAIFKREGLTTDTRYIASTGIEAKMFDVNSLVSLDAISVSNLDKKQIVNMKALEYLCPTNDYGVTFERGTKVIYGDRNHYYISGTASIDKHGAVQHLADIVCQANRAIDNVEALLTSYQASLSDLVYAIVYLRNRKDYDLVLGILQNRLPADMPLILVEGSVCRPSWLFEIEGFAITKGKSSFPAFL